MEEGVFISKFGVIAALLWSLLLCVALNVVLRVPAVRLGLVDVPGGRKQHAGRIPLVGGLSVALAFAFGLYLLKIPPTHLAPLLAGMALLLACGLVDDLLEVRSATKLWVQAAAAVLMIAWGGLVVRDLGTLWGVGLDLGVWGYCFTLVVVVGLINAINMMDGVDGLAGGVVLGAMFWLALVASLTQQAMPAVMVLTLAVTLLGFLWFNLRHPWRDRASVFLGDAGSLVLGFALAWFAVSISQHQSDGISPFAIAWVLALPVIDTISLVLRRLLKGRSPFAADRQHLHHLLIHAGYRTSTVALVLMGVNFLLGGIGVIASWLGVSDAVLFFGFLGLFVLHAGAVLGVSGWRARMGPGEVLLRLEK